MMVCSYLALGRGSEIRFLKWATCMWDYNFESPDFQWIDMKNLKVHPCMLFSADSNSYLCDFYHSLGCWFAVEDGLARPAGTKDEHAPFVIPALQTMKSAKDSSYVAALISKTVKERVLPTMKPETSSRSLRRGGATLCAAHPKVTEANLNERGGWSSGVQCDCYKESNPAVNLPACRALTGWLEPQAMAYPPRLDFLPPVSLPILSIQSFCFKFLTYLLFAGDQGCAS